MERLRPRQFVSMRSPPSPAPFPPGSPGAWLPQPFVQPPLAEKRALYPRLQNQKLMFQAHHAEGFYEIRSKWPISTCHDRVTFYTCSC